ncbi:hypothetical protein caldi_32670 [Caldinitratiruptor microaerophilus]|uniref:Copper amine oxidase-like N-terminal domain-containing protein n=2 Tax=Caldinitratiruptor microaerophilus TaxID=671077 RepID=A0AA35CN03_9FIRM|nr:hypothetical protein caldi_32670 [Caldinitratiruptor microaerophilus]
MRARLRGVRARWLLYALAVTAAGWGASAWAGTRISIEVNGKPVATDVAPMNVNGRVLIPIRFVAEALGADVTWDGATQTVRIRTAGRDIRSDEGNRTPVYQPSFAFRNVALKEDVQGDLHITGEVLNQSGSTRRYVTVRAKFYDAEGHVSGGTDYRPVQPETVANGEAAHFDLTVPSYLTDAARFDLLAAYLD